MAVLVELELLLVEAFHLEDNIYDLQSMLSDCLSFIVSDNRYDLI